MLAAAERRGTAAVGKVVVAGHKAEGRTSSSNCWEDRQTAFAEVHNLGTQPSPPRLV